MRDSGKSALDGNVTSALSQWPRGWYRLQEIASLHFDAFKDLGRTTDSSADVTRLGGAICPPGPPLFLKLKPKQKPKLKAGSRG